ncbi:hypothetical protein Lal_00041076 [Lupinus albus]|nr:hypothetical protein Lal_00041076 [Lupinus albus]
MFAFLYLNQELVSVPRLMLQTFTTIDLTSNNKIMIHLQADTTLNINDGPYVPPPNHQQRQQQVINNPPPPPSEPSLEELVRKMTMQNMQFQQETRSSIQRQESSILKLTS